MWLSATTELTATLLLRPTGLETLATQFWVYTTGLAYGAAAPYAAIMIAMSVVPVVAARPRARRRGARRRAGSAIVDACDERDPIEELTAGYGRPPVLRRSTWSCRSGSLTCVLGASGCGKTTLLRVIAGFAPAQRGHGPHRRAGSSTTAATASPPERRRVGYVPQEGALFPHLTVADNIGFALSRRTARRRAHGAGAVSRDARARRGCPTSASATRTSSPAASSSASPSPGRWPTEPEVVLLDEPFASLDASLRARLREEIRTVLRAAGATAILVTHDRSEALSLGDQVAVMRDGRIIQAGPPDELYTAPADAETAAFVSDAAMLDARCRRGRRDNCARTDRDRSEQPRHARNRPSRRPTRATAGHA